MKKNIEYKNYICPNCKHIIRDLFRHNSKTLDGKTRCYKHQYGLFEKHK